MATVKTILDRKGPKVVTIVPDDSVLTAAKLMNQLRIGGVVVVEDDEIVGIFTERDILRRIVAERIDPATTPLREVMTSPVITCSPDAPLDEVRALITEKRIRHMPVIDADGLCGIVTSGDLLAHQAEEQADTIQYLNSYMFDVRT